jgi:hypothetical protein
VYRAWKVEYRAGVLDLDDGEAHGGEPVDGEYRMSGEGGVAADHHAGGEGIMFSFLFLLFFFSFS